MKIEKFFPITLLFLAGALFAHAQSFTPGEDPGSRDLYGPREGSNEFAIGGGGASNRDFDDSFGAANFSIGHYFARTQELVIRQSVNYTNPNNAKRSWAGSTLLAFDQLLLPNGPVRPFIGINAGGVYGDNVRDTWAAGLEGGVKYYVLPRTFVELAAQYAWYFQKGRDIKDRFDTGNWNWSLGLGFNF
ncbi:MAG: hypothetical protein QM790_08190 [Nibricoccus sp.]